MPVSPGLTESVYEDRKQFPYITENLKAWEPFRIKVCYILEKLNVRTWGGEKPSSILFFLSLII